MKRKPTERQVAEQQFHDYYVRLFRRRKGKLKAEDRKNYEHAMRLEMEGRVRPLPQIEFQGIMIGYGSSGREHLGIYEVQGELYILNILDLRRMMRKQARVKKNNKK